MHKRVWILLPVIAVIAGHGAFFYYISSRVNLSVAMVLAVIVVLAIKLVVIKPRKLHR